MFNFRSTNAKPQSPEGSIGCCVAIAACYQHAWRDQALLWDYNMLNALAGITQSIKCDLMFGAVFFQIIDQQLGLCVWRFDASGGVDMIYHRKMCLRTPDL